MLNSPLTTFNTVDTKFRYTNFHETEAKFLIQKVCIFSIGGECPKNPSSNVKI
jgi:hypothetical protein